MFDPCCGCMSLQQGVKYCAIVKILMEVLAIVVCAFGILFFFLWSPEAKTAHAYGYSVFQVVDTWDIIGLIGIILIFIISIPLLIVDVLLLLGASKRNLSRCRIWLIVNLILLILNFIFGGVSYVGSLGFGASGWLGSCFTIYMLMVVWAFCEELKREQLGTPAFEAIQPAPVYGQPSQSQGVGQESYPSHHSSKASMRTNP